MEIALQEIYQKSIQNQSKKCFSKDFEIDFLRFLP